MRRTVPKPPQNTSKTPAHIYIGVGGWTFAPWRGVFYPEKLTQAKELEYAASKLTSIEINGTYYGSQKPESFRKWAREVPDGFVFSLKGPRFATNRRVLADAGDSIERFVASGLVALGHKLGPIVWQFAPTKRFDAGDFEAFLKLLPREVGGIPLRHVLDVRHESFRCSAYLELARRHGMATVFTDSDDYPSFADVTGGLVYVRTMRTEPSRPLGCSPQALDQIAACARVWRDGGEPAALPRVEAPLKPQPERDVFLFFISGAKERAPAAAMAVLERLT